MSSEYHARQGLLITRFGRRGFLAGAGLAACALVAGERWVTAGARGLPVPIDQPLLARYLAGVRDLPTPVWSLLVATAGVIEPAGNTYRALAGRLQVATLRGAVNRWSYRAESRQMQGSLKAIGRTYAAVLPPDRAMHYSAALDAEWRRLEAGGQVDYPGLAHLATLVNRESGLMARVELEHLQLLRHHAVDPVGYPRDVAALLAERAERRQLAAAFRERAARLLAGAGDALSRPLALARGPATLLADLGRAAGPPRNYYLALGQLPDLHDDTLMARAIYYTAGEFLAFEPPAPPGRWADLLPADQRAYAPTNALSPRLRPAELLAPERASRVLWPDLRDCRDLVAELGTL
jgi:hypothetical protein